MDMEWIGIIAGILTSSSLLPQLIKLIKTRKAEDLSMVFLLLLMSGLACWVWYGIKRNDWPIIITNSFSFLVNGMMIILGLRFKRFTK